MEINKESPIGIFDSGIGGLTVARAVREALPNEHIIYYGDTARVPYGIKSVETVREYALQITRFLLERNVKMILVACNTVSASVNGHIVNAAHPIPVLDVIQAGRDAALKQMETKKRIGVIGTLATIGSGSYDHALNSIDSEISIFSRACPLLVPLAEEGWVDNEIARKTLEIYLNDFHDRGLESLILGCTHYPLFIDTINEVLQPNPPKIVDSATAIADSAKLKLKELELLNDTNREKGTFSCYVSDKPQRFQQLAERFMGSPIHRVDIVRL